MNALVSVIAPAYNHEKYIESALESITLQTYRNKELIVIDDCSSDRTPELIEQYIAKDRVKNAFTGGIKYIRHTQNQNAHHTINEGIATAKGEYIAVINTDDLYESNRLEVMMQTIKQENGRFAFSRVKIIDSAGMVKEYEPFNSMSRKIKMYPCISLVLAIENVGISTGNYVFEKNLYYEVGGFDSLYHFIHDWDFILKVSLKTEPLYVETTNYIYRFHDTNTLKQIDESREMKGKKDWEVRTVLESYLSGVLHRFGCNPLLPPAVVWDYFLNYKEVCFASSIWNELRSE